MAIPVEAREKVNVQLAEDRLEKARLYWVRDTRDPEHLAVLIGRYARTEFDRFVVFVQETGYPFEVLREHIESGETKIYTEGGYIVSQIAGELGYIPDNPEEAIKRSWLLRQPLDDKGIAAIMSFYSERGL